MARALADPSYHDPDPWVSKGRDAFGAEEDEWDNQRISRRIGDLLGNDLGQMRIQFDPMTYVVQPPYRDDNLGLWDFHDDGPKAEEAEQVFRQPASGKRRTTSSRIASNLKTSQTGNPARCA